MQDRLRIQKDGVEHDGGNADESELELRIQRPGRRQGIVRQHQRDRREHDQHAEIDVHARRAEFLLAVTKPAGQNAGPDQTVADDHDHREHGITRQFRHRLVAQHDRRDQGNLDDRDRERQQQRSVRLADPLRDDLGVVHGRENRAEQDHQQHEGEQDAARRGEEGDAETGHCAVKQHGQGRKNPRRARHRTMRAHRWRAYAARLRTPFFAFLVVPAFLGAVFFFTAFFLTAALFLTAVFFLAAFPGER